MSDTPKTEDSMIAALLRERDGYQRRGLDDRVALVNEQLVLRGYQVQAAEPEADPEPETAPPKGRATKPRRTAGGG